jgi:hypothetical protein
MFRGLFSRLRLRRRLFDTRPGQTATLPGGVAPAAALHRRTRRSRRQGSPFEALEPRALLAATTFETDATWLVASSDPGSGWTDTAFDDSAFASATVISATSLLDGEPADRIWAETVTGADPETPDTVWLRKSLTLDGRPASASLDLDVNDDMEVFINGVAVLTDTDLTATTRLNLDVAGQLRGGENVIAVKASNTPGTTGQFFAARLDIDTERADFGDTMSTATAAGVVPGLHIAAATLADAADVDFLKIELLRPDSIVVQAAYDA